MVLRLGCLLALAVTTVPQTDASAQRTQPSRLELGDIILRDTTGAVFRLGRESVSFSPSGDFRRSIPIMLEVETVSTIARPDAETSVAIVGNAGRDSLPLLRFRFPSPLRIGTTTVRHELDVARIPAGQYRVDLFVVDTTTGHVLNRGVFLRLR